MRRICWNLLALLVVSRAVLAADKKPDVDELGRTCRAGDKKSCNRLMEIAKSTSDSKLGTTAVENLSDQVLLTEIARNAKRGASAAREAAIDKLTDQSALLSIARGHRDSGARSVAVARLTDQAALAGIAKNDTDADVRKAAVAKLTDQAALAGIAKNDTDVDVRKAAVAILTDQDLLAAIARNDRESKVRVAAIGKITDRSVLAAVAKSQFGAVRAAAIDRLTAPVKTLTDQATLAQIARSDENKYVHWAAVKKLADAALVTEVGEAWRALHPHAISFEFHVSLKGSYVHEHSFRRSIAMAPPGFQLAVVDFVMSNEFDTAQRLDSRQIHLAGPNGQNLGQVLVGFAGEVATGPGTTSVSGSKGDVSYSVIFGPDNGIRWFVGPLADYSDTLVFVIPADVSEVHCEFAPSESPEKTGVPKGRPAE